MLISTSAEVCYYLSEKLLLSQKLYVTSEGAVSHNVLYYQQLSIAVCFFHNVLYYQQLSIAVCFLLGFLQLY